MLVHPLPLPRPALFTTAKEVVVFEAIIMVISIVLVAEVAVWAFQVYALYLQQQVLARTRHQSQVVVECIQDLQVEVVVC